MGFWGFGDFGDFGSQIYIANLAIFKIWVFLATFWHEITLYAIGTLSKRKNDIIWEIFPTWGGVFPNPKTFVNLPSIFLYAKFILRC